MEKAFWVMIVAFYDPQDVPKDFPDFKAEVRRKLEKKLKKRKAEEMM
jgi:hypothetical protein